MPFRRPNYTTIFENRLNRITSHLNPSNNLRHFTTSKYSTSNALNNMNTSSDSFKSKNKSSETLSQKQSDVLITNHGSIGKLLILNRPKALNSLNCSMIDKMIPLYRKLKDEKQDKILIMKGFGSKAFCAGGDIFQIYKAKIEEKKSVDEICHFFRSEYELNKLIGTMPENVVQISMWNGIVMGGGVGLSVHGRYRIATNSTLFAMPEVNIGLFPDVGGSYFLPRLKGNLGMYLALTGDRLRGADVYHAGIATHYVPQDKMPQLESELLQLNSSFHVRNVLDQYSLTRNSNKTEKMIRENQNETELQEFKLLPYIDKIQHIFGQNSVEAILKDLEKEASSRNEDVNYCDWAKRCLKMMNQASPTSLKITFEQLKKGKTMSFVDCFNMEYNMTREIVRNNDFFEGIRTVLKLDKNKLDKNESTSKLR